MKKTLASLCCLVLFLLLTGCGIEDPPNEDVIGGNLPAELTMVTVEDPFDMTSDMMWPLDVLHLSIEKRQTNEKEDVAYCRIELSNEYLFVTRYVMLNYNYYDEGGWILDSWEDYQEPEYRLIASPFDEQDAKLKWSYSYDNVSVEELKITGDTTVRYTVKVEKKYANASDTGKLINSYTLRPLGGNRYSWEETTDTSGVTRKWNIVGMWSGTRSQNLRSMDGVTAEYVTGCEVRISRFDAKTPSVAGTFTIAFPTLGTDYRYYQLKPEHDLQKAKVTVKNEKVILSWEGNTIEIGLNDISVDYPRVGSTSNFLPALKRRV